MAYELYIVLCVYMHLCVIRVCLISPQGKLSTMDKSTVKDMIWVRGGILASCAGETVVRFWDFEGGDNYSLEMGGPDNMEELITCISYCEEKGVFACVCVCN